MLLGVVSSLVLVAAVTAGSSVPTITQTPLACLSSDNYSKITAKVAGNPASVRVYFHAVGQTCGDYFVEMRRDPKDPTLYSAIIPIPAKDADVVLYQIKAKTLGGSEVAAAPVAATVKKECAGTPLSNDDLQTAKAIVLGLTQSAQKATPCKFRCDGVTNFLTASGDLKPNDECRLLLASLAKGGGGKPWYESTTAEVVGGALGAGALGWAIEHRRDHHEPSPARPKCPNPPCNP